MNTELYIDGQWTPPEDGRTRAVIDPATELPLGEVAEASVRDVDLALKAARRAFDEGQWSSSSVGERGAVLRRFAALLQQRRHDAIDRVISEVGTPVKLARGLQVSAPLEHLADMVDRVLNTYPFESPLPPTFGTGIGQGVVVREPAGVVAAITPFNYPFFTCLSKVAPALAAGCSVVLKPAPATPLSALLLAEVAHEAEIPPGVLNVVTSGDPGVGRRLSSHPAVDVVSFTGSVPVGAAISAQAAPTIKKVLLELGGKNADIVLDDADLEKAVAHFAYGFTRNSGQGCGCMTRLIVARSRHDEAVQLLLDLVGDFVVGDPRSPTTDLGPLISAAQRDRVESYVQVGLDEGAVLAVGGTRPKHLRRGYFFEPTVFTNVTSQMRIAREEIFGPVATVIAVADDDEAVAVANDSDFGLSGAVWSGDPLRAYSVARRLRTGQVTVNGGGGGTNPHAPYGGYKRSGIGREFGEAGLGEYLETKAVLWGVAPG
ncbi:aldehyde dehydrogenase family protein [Mycobacterium avium]|uniref:aldehyde dehydrogenase family protein n=1 Tax=Mycobacterium avium TaxID=1764 RepID=UPI001CC3A294|nr:aldehyde dehydrogenase family protein [Mycobacterium avium]MBZ4521860.1 aldehyde dehydrogenase family protein [Mycobacterium avium subsp. hominissuis]MBZ4531243.1 aldehyde dehydrogenase family protein [Mycobacterium avium subsp. hominissuis]